jgi:ABC-type multidrug transport system fused ATPase/permease subunit
MQTLKKLLELLTPYEHKRAGLLLVMILVMALLDMLGVASIMPFMAVLANPELVETNAILKAAYTASSHLGVDTSQQFLFALGIGVFVLLVGSLAFKALTTYAQLRFTRMREYSISKRLVEGYLHQPYSWFLSRHSADLGKIILSEVFEVIDKGVRPIMNLIAQGAIAIALLMLLIVIDPKLALIVGLTLVTAYGLIFKTTRGYLARIGQERVKANQERFTVVSEAFGAAKEVKVGGLECAYIQRFAEPAQAYARHQAGAQVISQLPRFALEAIAFGGMLLVMLYLMAQSGSFASALPIIALYAFAGYRLMPALQQIYGALTQLRFAGPALDALHKDLMSLQQPASANMQDMQDPAMPLTQVITLNNIVYRYPNATTPALKRISLSIAAKSTVGLVGATGSGKTTTVDLILGLLDAQEGTLAIDGQPITDHNKRAWQRAIGYVPQQIYLADDTVAANIAFGIDPEQIDQSAVERAAKIANLHEFVISDLPRGYATTVGERGVRLSGGQRQRIGIARALYHNPQVLILDEATSALDNLTEQAVMEAVHNLGHEITIILIAHRLSTVKDCDQIFLLEKGELKGQGRFEELTNANENFKKMAASH